ncbi:recombinase family protein [Nocardia sp. NPDC051981]|uniref:recombinase family protein n=1 Tax=Nocardia sp. NPDC051981 TaxID=3155417 RepID=UPI00342BCE90
MRISKADQDDYDAIDRQDEDLDERIADIGGQVVATYTDHSKSAYERYAKRPDYDRMFADYKAGMFDGIACWEIDRFTRIPAQLEEWIELGEIVGAVIVTIEETYDLRTESGRSKARDRANAARREMELKSKRQKRANRQRAAKGRPPKGVRATGYTLDGAIVADEAAVIEAIFTSFDAGTSLRGICAALSGICPEDEPDRDIPANVPAFPRRDGTDKPWHPSTVYGILRNPRYAGWSVHTPKRPKLSAKIKAEVGNRLENQGPHRPQIARDTAGLPVQGDWEAIVSDALFLRVQQRLDEPERATNRQGTDRKHLGSGLYRCGVCPRENALKVKAHNTRYRCAGHVMRTRAQIDQMVVEYITQRLGKADLAALLIEPDEGRAAELARQERIWHDKVKRARADYKAELIDGGLYSEIKTKADTELNRLQAERLTLTAGATASSILHAASPVIAFQTADLASKRAVIDLLCDVYLLPAPRGRKTFDPSSVLIVPK